MNRRRHLSIFAIFFLHINATILCINQPVVVHIGRHSGYQAIVFSTKDENICSRINSAMLERTNTTVTCRCYGAFYSLHYDDIVKCHPGNGLNIDCNGDWVIHLVRDSIGKTITMTTTFTCEVLDGKPRVEWWDGRRWKLWIRLSDFSYSWTNNILTLRCSDQNWTCINTHFYIGRIFKFSFTCPSSALFTVCKFISFYGWARYTDTVYAPINVTKDILDVTEVKPTSISTTEIINKSDNNNILHIIIGVVCTLLLLIIAIIITYIIRKGIRRGKLNSNQNQHLPLEEIKQPTHLQPIGTEFSNGVLDTSNPTPRRAFDVQRMPLGAPLTTGYTDIDATKLHEAVYETIQNSPSVTGDHEQSLESQIFPSDTAYSRSEGYEVAPEMNNEGHTKTLQENDDAQAYEYESPLNDKNYTLNLQRL